MKKILKKIYKIYVDLKDEYIWYSESKKIIKNIQKNRNLSELSLNGKKMILIPHSDDEWIGCSGIINRVKGERIIFCNMDMQGGDSKDLHEIRYKELENTVNKYNAILYTITSNKMDNLKKIIKEEQPKFIFVPFFIDWHPEHIETINILYNVIKMLQYECEIIAYQVSLPVLPDFINAYVPMNKEEFDKKWNYFKKNYKTQIKIPYKRFMYNEKINGCIVNQYACEVFVVCTTKQWLNLYEKNWINEVKKEDIISSLNSISDTRKKLKKIYLKLGIGDKIKDKL